MSGSRQYKTRHLTREMIMIPIADEIFDVLKEEEVTP